MREIRRVLVLGANGTMGSGAAALFAARGFDVTLLARTLEKAESGREAAKRAVRAEVIGDRLICGSYDHLEDFVAKADLVVEAVAERLDLKQHFFERIDRARAPDAWVATVSSGLSINAMADARSPSFRQHFLGMHLFNPPQVIVGTEVIAGTSTDPRVFEAAIRLLEDRLGRVVVVCRDQPAFAGNRVGFKLLNECARLALEHGAAQIDYLIGPHTGRALAPLATIDLVGWDVHRAIVDNVFAQTSDEAHDHFALPGFMAELIERGHLGNKTPANGGFFRRPSGNGATPLVLDPATGEYRAYATPRRLEFVEGMKKLHRVGRYADAMALFLAAEGPEAELARRVILGYVAYGLNRVGPGEVVDRTLDVDLIMAYGFNWAPPGVLVDLFGRDATIASMQRLGLAVPFALRELPTDEPMFRHRATNVGRYFVAR